MSDIERLGLGQIITTPQERDAVHIAVVPMKVHVPRYGYGLPPGTPVGFLPGHDDTVCAANADSREYGSNIEAIGIIDPFLKLGYEGVQDGETVWVYLNPGSVTGLRHHWSHPAFDKAKEEGSKMNEDEKWLRKFAVGYNFDYDNMIETATNPDASAWGAYITARGIDLHSRPEEHNEFWRRLGSLKGKVFTEAHQDKVSWSCSC